MKHPLPRRTVSRAVFYYHRVSCAHRCRCVRRALYLIPIYHETRPRHSAQARTQPLRIPLDSRLRGDDENLMCRHDSLRLSNS